MRSGARVFVALCALAFGACSSGGPSTSAAPPATTTSTVPADPLERALLTERQLRRVPGLSTAQVFKALQPARFAEANPRGPCGAPVPKLAFDRAVAATWRTSTVGAVHVALRRPATELRSYVAARIANISPGCAPFEVVNQAGPTQMRFTEAISVTRDADQSLAVVMAAGVGSNVRAETAIEVRLGDVLSRMVVLSAQPLPADVVRGLASLMAKALESVA